MADLPTDERMRSVECVIARGDARRVDDAGYLRLFLRGNPGERERAARSKREGEDRFLQIGLLLILVLQRFAQFAGSMVTVPQAQEELSVASASIGRLASMNADGDA